MYPLEGGYTVEHPHIPRILVLLSARGEVEESEDVQAVVDAHHDHILPRQAHTGIPCRCSRVESAAVEPQHHRLTGVAVGRPHVEHTAVLRHLSLAHRAVGLLHGLRSPLVTLSHTLPGLHRLRRHEAFDLCVWYSEESLCAFLNDSLDKSRADSHRELSVFVLPS